MRALISLALAATALAAPAAGASTSSSKRTLDDTLSQDLQQAGGSGGAFVLDLTTGQALFGASGRSGFLPASVEKLYTTSTALLKFGPTATLKTRILGRGFRGKQGTWHGTLYVRGGGDPTFGSAAFDQSNYGTGGTMEALVTSFIRSQKIRALKGNVVGDETYFDSLRGTPATGYAFSPYVEGSLSAVAYNRGLTPAGDDYIHHPARFAAEQFVSSLRSHGVNVPSGTPTRAGKTPKRAKLLAVEDSPPIKKLITLTNAPSDNFFAEMLLKGLGARFAGAGTTARGASVVRSEVAHKFGVYPQLDDGSGLSRDDATSPRQVVKLLSELHGNHYFVHSLAIAGESGTLQNEMQGTAAQGRCRGKTGTLHDVANLVGYCRSYDGHILAFAFLINGVDDPTYTHSVEGDMAAAVAKYDG